MDRCTHVGKFNTTVRIVRDPPGAAEEAAVGGAIVASLGEQNSDLTEQARRRKSLERVETPPAV